MENYEKLGTFYLGRTYDTGADKLGDELVLYDAKDLTTHAVIVGMTGSGKTGLGIGLLEEALIDNIPVIAIDPKGDLPSLLLGFPELRPEDFRPWVNEQEALAKGLTAAQFAAQQAQLWKKGLARWGQSPERIARLQAAADFAVYTPGSSAGLPINVLRSFAAPPPSLVEDGDLLRERIQTTTVSLLALLGIDADPITSREHILIAKLFEDVWRQGRSLDLAGLIRAIQKPGFERIGIMDLEDFYPAGDRLALAMRLNDLLASPGFEAWLQGEPLDAGRLLFTAQGKPRASIFSIGHLSDEQRMFFVSLLLNEVLAWMRSQSGTTSLRAILYMDEIFGYFPPVKNPPSKAPLLTLLKQARAYGLGVVLCTQNPVDLDYKGLSNTGTWFIGRLQTERDAQRLLTGLEGAGGAFDRGAMQQMIAGLGSRVFLMHNVHENEPAVFQTRWALSYLRGPLTREQIKTLMAERKRELSAASPQPAAVAEAAGAQAPEPPREVESYFLRASGAGQGLTYYPGVVARLSVHYASARYGVDTQTEFSLAAHIEEGPVALEWDAATEIALDPADLASEPLAGARYADLPAQGRKKSAYRKWEKDLVRWVRQNRPMELFRSKRFKLTSEPGETEGQFRSRLAQTVREKKDLAAGKLRKKYGRRFETLKNRLMRAEQAIAREEQQARAKQMDTVISFGTAILGAFLGRKAVSARSASRMGTALKTAGRVQKEKMDVARARETAEAVRRQMAELEAQLQEELNQLEFSFDPAAEELDRIPVRAKSTDIAVEIFAFAWLPYRAVDGRLTPDWV